MENKYRVNEEIVSAGGNVLVVDKESGNKTMTLREAQELANQNSFDLIQIGGTEEQPVCKIEDFSKFMYRENKQKKQKKQKNATVDTKELRIGLRISDHDLETKINTCRKFLEKGHPVKLRMQLKGREISYIDTEGKKSMQRAVDKCSVFAKCSEIKQESFNTLMVNVARA